MPLETRQRRVYDTSLCSLPVNTTPNPQFDPDTAVCDQVAPRTASTRSAKKKDVNPDSPTFGQWLKANGSYVTLQANGDLFAYDTDPVACPLPVAKTLRMDARLVVCNVRVTATRNDAPASPLTVTFELAEINDGSALPVEFADVTIPAGQYTATAILQYGLQANLLYIIQNMEVSDLAYPTPGNSNVVGTPTPNVC